MMKKPEVFLCYARKDELLRKELEKQLATLKREGLIDVWYDREINAGAVWQQEIENHLNSAQVILLLVSPDFMASDYCYNVEMVRALERHMREEVLVIPIILRPVHWQASPIGGLQALPTDAQPVMSSYWHNSDTAFYNVAEGIRKAVKTLSLSSPLPVPPVIAPPMHVASEPLRSRRKVLVSIATVAIMSIIGGIIAWLSAAHLPWEGTTDNTRIIKVATNLNAPSIQNGAFIAFKENRYAITGYTLQFVARNDSTSADILNINALALDAQVAGVVGPFTSSLAEHEMPRANLSNLAMISPSNTNPCLTQSSEAVGCSGTSNQISDLRPTRNVTYFRIATTEDHQGPVIADYLYKVRHYKSAYVIDDAQSYGTNLANTFITEWGKLHGKLYGHSAWSEIKSSTLTEIAAQKPDMIYFAGEDTTGVRLLLQQMQQFSTLKNIPFAGGDHIINEKLQQIIDGPFFVTVDASSEVTQHSTITEAFIKRYPSTYKDVFDMFYSAAGYDCMMILIAAIKSALADGAKAPTSSSDSIEAPIFRLKVIDAIKKTNYYGLTGHHTFDANGDTTQKSILVKQFDKVTNKWSIVPQW